MRRRLDYLCLQPTLEGQASYAHVNEIVAGLRRRGWEVRLIEVPHPRPGRADGIRRAVAAMTIQAQYWARCRFRPADFVYIRDHFLALPTAVLAWAAGATVVQECNGPLEDAYDAWPRLRPLHRLLSLSLRFQSRRADAVVIVTPGLEGYLTASTGRRGGYYVIGNGADVDRFRPAIAGARTGGQSYVVFVGALASWQGIDVILSAAKAAAWPPNIDLVIAGDGRERGLVQEAARACDRIRWLGTIPYEESAALVSGSLAALVPMIDGPRSKFGLSPLKLYEAMACGVPVIASDLPGSGDIVRAHDCGITFPAGDHEALARAVARIVGDPGGASEMGSRGRAAAVALYSWDARAAQTERVLLQVSGMRAVARRLPGHRLSLFRRRRQHLRDTRTATPEAATKPEETPAIRAGGASGPTGG
jgi:glycosyltransferase involved in cell wall biosynthesis